MSTNSLSTLRILLSLLIWAIFSIFTNNIYAIWAIQSSYFDKNVLWESESFNETINAINIGNYTFSNSVEQKRYLNSKRFFQTAKAEIREKFELNEISTYRASDIIRDLEYVSYYLDEYFKNTKMYERTRNITYKNIAKTQLAKVERSYRNLTVTTRSIYR